MDRERLRGFNNRGSAENAVEQAMNNVEVLENFARFWAARAATDTPDTCAFITLGEGSTDPHSLRRLYELPLASMAAKASRHGAPTGSTTVEFSEPAAVEAPVSDILDNLKTPKGQIQRQITALRIGGGLPYRERLAHRLVFLLEALEEEGETWGTGSPDSLRQMLLFLRAAADLSCPTVTITPSATFRAQWQAGQNRHFAIDFLPDGQVRFVVFSPDPRHPDRAQRVSGIVGWVDVIRAVEPYGVHRWAADAGA
jgi:hypothetical protein